MEWKSLDFRDPTWLLFERRDMFTVSFSWAQELSGFPSELKIYLLSKIGSQGVCRTHISPTRPTLRRPLHSSSLSVNSSCLGSHRSVDRTNE